MAIELNSIFISAREAKTLIRITGKKDPSDAAVQLLNRAMMRAAHREAALAAYQPSPKVIAAVRAIDAAMDRRERIPYGKPRTNPAAKRFSKAGGAR